MQTVHRLQQNEQLGPTQANFEELLSMLAIQNTMQSGGLLRGLSTEYSYDPEVLNCLIYFIPRLFADRLAMDGELQKNRNLFYAVRREDVVRAFQASLWKFCDNNIVNFVSFNYDGLLEAFLDCALGTDEEVVFRYYPEFSHGIPLTRFENALGREFHQNFSRPAKQMPSCPMIFKPHGSIHLYTVQPEIAKMLGTPTMLVLTPRFGMAGMQHNDIPDLGIWDSANPAPFIVPPIMNKDQFLLQDYSRLLIPKVARTFFEAEYILSLGFSIPRSDLYVRSLLGLLSQSQSERQKRVALVWQERPGDTTWQNWCSLFGEENIKHKINSGLPLENTSEVELFWNEVARFLDE